MRQTSGLFGLVGVVLLLFAVVNYLLTGAFSYYDQLYIGAHAIGGILALVAYFAAGTEHVRRLVGERSTRYGASTTLATIFFIAIVVALNFLSTRYHHRIDLTEARVYSLSPQSTQVAQGLTAPLELRAYVQGGVNPALDDLLSRYAYASDQIRYEMLDPDRRPELAEQDEITAYETVVLAYGDRSATVLQPTEESLTNAIIKVTRAATQTICFVEGHGEPSIADRETAGGFAAAKSALEGENYDTETLLLLSAEQVPEHCAVVVVAPGEKPYQAAELAVLDDYLRAGGRVLVFLAPDRGDALAGWLAGWGVTVHDDIVIDQQLRLLQGPVLGVEPLVQAYAPHEVTQGLGPSTFPMTRSLEAAAGDPTLQVTELALTGPASWAETDLTALFDREEAQLDDTDRPGPVAVAALVEGQPGDEDTDTESSSDAAARLAVFGSTSFADNRSLRPELYNRDLFLNAVGWLAGQSDLVSIRAKTLRASRVHFTPEQGTVLFYLSVLLMPELLLILGLAVWWKRE